MKLKHIIYKLSLSLLLVLSTCVLVQAQQNSIPKYLPAKPTPARLVNDLANMLTPGQVEALEYKLKTFNDSTSNEVAIVTVANLQDRDIENYANELFRYWGIGGKENNNGVLLLIALDDRKSRIEVGYGLEGALPDLISSEILRYDITENFKQQNYYKGINDATDNIIAATKNEYQADTTTPISSESEIPILPIILFAILIIFLIKNAQRNNKYYMSRRGHKGWGNDDFGGGTIFPGGFIGGGGFFDGGGDSGGGFGGGGFGGFGGGSSGGGGASGSW